MTAPETEDAVTEPGTAADGDRAEQAASLDEPEVTIAGDARAPRPDVPEADALEQQLVARPRGTGSGTPSGQLGDREADEVDVLDQEADVPIDGDDLDD